MTAPGRQVIVVPFALTGERDVFTLRRHGQSAARTLGLPGPETVRLATVLSEVGRNLLGAAGLVAEVALTPGRPELLTVTLQWEPPAEPAPEVLAAAGRLLHTCAYTSGPPRALVLQQPLPPAGEELDVRAADVRGRMTGPPAISMSEELRDQNSDLLAALQQARAHQEELQRLNAELEETNQGVVALYSELSRELEATNTGVVALYAELEDKTKQLSLASEAKTRFWANVSHELRSPVNAVIGLARLMLAPEADPLTEEQRRQVSLIAASGSTLASLVEELLDVAKAESGRLEPDCNEVDLRTVLLQLRGTLQSTARPGVRFAVPDRDFPHPLVTDEVMLTRVLRNVLSNGLKFTRTGEVSLEVAHTVRDGRPWYTFTARDTGIGIPEDQQERVFEEFYQVRGPHQRAVAGTGLGLPYARRLTELLGGRLRLSSEPGAGTEVVIELPAEPGTGGDAPVVADAEPPSAPGGGTPDAAPGERSPGAPGVSGGEAQAPGAPGGQTPAGPGADTPRAPGGEAPVVAGGRTPGASGDDAPGAVGGRNSAVSGGEAQAPGAPGGQTPAGPGADTPGAPGGEAPVVAGGRTPGASGDDAPGAVGGRNSAVSGGEAQGPGASGGQTPAGPGADTPGAPGGEAPVVAGGRTPAISAEEARAPGAPGTDTPAGPGTDTPAGPGREIPGAAAEGSPGLFGADLAARRAEAGQAPAAPGGNTRAVSGERSAAVPGGETLAVPGGETSGGDGGASDAPGTGAPVAPADDTPAAPGAGSTTASGGEASEIARAAAPAGAPPVVAPGGAPVGSGQEPPLHRLVTVDDEPASLAVARPALARLAREVTEVADSSRALGVVRDRRPDAVLLDLFMPGTDGYQLLAELAADPELAAVPVVVVTSADLADIDTGRLGHARAVLGKSQISADRLARALGVPRPGDQAAPSAPRPPSTERPRKDERQ
ncbi:ATP-binding protein [Streptomyces sp. LP05-1]|uniref:histidine kinase n=1 Tax=Streptomyces pyxinae TaxID=2970734 RepID=A0ABT2CBP4_9ACTN|nr:ATP-binding protein [Streptomyces sp. LP05-1]MCS0634827.1 ATP-binding protein [Streptomyces sp. LP05-1]